METGVNRPAGSFARIATPIKAWAQRFAVLLLIGASFGLMLMGKADVVMIERARTTVSDAVAPVLDAASRPVASVAELLREGKELAALRAENAALRRENARLEHWRTVGAIQMRSAEACTQLVLAELRNTAQRATSADALPEELHYHANTARALSEQIADDAVRVAGPDGEFDQPFSALLVATGATAATGPFDLSPSGAFTLHGMDDAAALRALVTPPGDPLEDGDLPDAVDRARVERYADDLVPEVLSSAKEARKRMQAGEDVLPGIRSGIDAFDEILGGFQEGLTIVGGGPGIGKTTYALQAARHAAKDEEVPVLYVTFENSPEGLTRKGICSIAGVSPRAVRRGQVPTGKVRTAAKRWKQETRRLAFVEGTADLTTSRIRTKAKRHTGRFGADRCLIVLDYLQLFAKRSEQFERYTDQRERVQKAGNELRAAGMALRSPVLAIASQSRKAGNYGGDDAQEQETGSARLDSLKESGDLEYSADAVAFLTPPISNPDRASRVVEPNRAVDLTVAKNRHGETGRVELVFRQAEGTMMPEAKHDETPQGKSPGGDGVPRADTAVF